MRFLLFLTVFITSQVFSSTHIFIMKGYWSELSVLAAVDINQQNEITIVNVTNVPKDVCGSHIRGADFDGKSVYLATWVIWSPVNNVCQFDWDASKKEFTFIKSFVPRKTGKGSLTIVPKLNGFIYYDYYDHEVPYANGLYFVDQATGKDQLIMRAQESETFFVQTVNINGRELLLSNKRDSALDIFEVSSSNNEVKLNLLKSTHLNGFIPYKYFQIGNSSKILVEGYGVVQLLNIDPQTLEAKIIDEVRFSNFVRNLSIAQDLKSATAYYDYGFKTISIQDDKLIVLSDYEFPDDTGSSSHMVKEGQVLVIESTQTPRGYHQNFMFTLLDTSRTNGQFEKISSSKIFDEELGLKGDDQRLLLIYKSFTIAP